MRDLIATMKMQEPHEQEKPKYSSSRTEMIAKLYDFYEKDKKRLDHIAYAKWLFRNRYKPSPQNIEKWKATIEFRKPITPASFASFWLGHIRTGDLYYLLSIAQDMENRKKSFNKWLLWSLNPKNFQSVV